MHPQKSRFVALCQQLLVLGAVFAALVPAASVVSLDVVREQPIPQQGQSAAEETALAAYASVADQATPVAAGKVTATLHEYALTPPAAASGAVARSTGGSVHATAAVATSAADTAGLHATTVADTETGTTTITSDPQQVTGYGTVGVTWEHGQDIGEGDISFELRTAKDGEWGDWQDLTYHDEHGPDPGSAEAAAARPGTDEALVGHVDQVQVRAEVKSDEVPEDLKLAVIDPGKVTATKAETPDIDTSELPAIPDAVPDGSGDLIDTPSDTPSATPSDTPTEPSADTESSSDTGAAQDGLTLAASTIVATKPYIYSRAQWGANEKVREQTAPSYGSVHGGFVHHTVNANDYTAAEVPAIIRSIYTYHVKSRGWRDIGYNFLIDKFGRIWEGRYGGVERNVVGAHTENYNTDSFGASAIGNYDIAAPPQAVVGAFGALMGWKLAINGVSASATNVKIGRKVFSSSIMAHRDTKATACPGKYLYARMNDIRKIAAAAQQPLTYGKRNQNLAGAAYPDIIARRTSDKRGVIIPTTGASGFTGRTSLTIKASYTAVLSPDLTGDGRADLVLVTRAGRSVVRPGNGRGGFGKGIKPSKQQAGRNMITAIGDVDGDHHNDLFSRDAKTGTVVIWLGRGNGTFKRQRLKTHAFAGYNLVTAGGDVDGDGKVDLLGRDANGVLWLHPGKGNGAFPGRRSLGGGWQAYDSIVAGDFTKDGLADVMVRSRANKKAYVRANLGGTGFGIAVGAYSAVRKVGSLQGAANVMGDAGPDVLARTGARLDVFVRGTGTELGAPVVTNLDLSNADLVLNAGDWNGDGHGDVFYRETSGALYLTLGNGAGSFSGRYSFGTGFGKATLIAAVGDMNGDGHSDLMAQLGSQMKLWPGNGSTGFGSTIVMYGAVAGSAQLPADTWDAGTTPDVLVRNGNALVLYPGNGPAGLGTPRTLSTNLAAYDWVIGVGPLEATGHSDLVVRNRSNGTLYALKGNADGTLRPARPLGSGFGGYDLAG